MEFHPGDTVRLKSGSPTMTVEQTGTSEMTGIEFVSCTWFEKIGARHDVKRESFSPATLEVFKPARMSSELI